MSSKLERFQEKWKRFSGSEARPNKGLESFSDSVKRLTTPRALTVLGIMLFGACVVTGNAGASRADTDQQAFVAASSTFTSIPIGHAQFCREHISECSANQTVVAVETLTEARWRQLLRVNTGINAEVVPVTDEQLYHVQEFWTYPQGFGDCEDYVLAKRKSLIAQGWPASTLLITVVKQANGEGHAVLMVRTDRGDLVLDNQTPLVKLWSQTPYQFIKRQSQTNPGQWVTLYDTRPTDLAALN